MAAIERILVHLKKARCNVPTKATFSQSVMDFFGISGNMGQLHAELVNNQLIVSTEEPLVKIKRPSFCPIHNLCKEDLERIPDDILNRGVDVGAAVILESSDNKVLLTRRAQTLRTFPGVWVPPGGHLEADETFVQGALRELKEETGLDLNPNDFEGGDVKVMALWESVFPPKLSLGMPKRHHIVIYVYGKLTSIYNAECLTVKQKLEPDEVGASAWLDRKLIQAIVTFAEEEMSKKVDTSNLPEKISGLVIDENKEQSQAEIPFKPFLQTASDIDCERVSTGTKFALEEFLSFTSK